MNVEDMKKDPIFAMSLSSKELFHSNFWAWLCGRELDKENTVINEKSKGIKYINIFFPDLKNVTRVEREKNNRDVTFWESGKAYIIENKFKAIPDKEQLLRYQNELEEPKNPKNKIIVGGGILTGVITPYFIEDPELDKWHFKPYAEIGKEIVEIANSGIETDDFQRNLIISYGKLLQNLHEVFSNKLTSVKERWVYYDNELDEIRMNDMYSKMIAWELAKYLRDHLELAEHIGDYELIIRTGYGQGGVIVDVRYEVVDEALKETYRNPPDGVYRWNCLGVQIERKEYRWCASIAYTYEKYSSDTDRLFEEVRTRSNWFVKYDYEKDSHMITDHIDSKSKRRTSQSWVKDLKKTKIAKKKFPYHMYSGKKDDPYTFLYQYWTIRDNESFDAICSEVQRDMDRAAEILKEYIKTT